MSVPGIIHINGDISYAVVQYYLITNDWDFMVSKGAEILIETARMWYDLGIFIREASSFMI